MESSVLDSFQRKETLKQSLSLLHDDFEGFCMAMLPEMFEHPFSKLHLKILAVIKSKKKRKKLILAPRGVGKTTIGKAVVIDRILFRKRKFIVYISNSLDMAMMQTENIKRTMLSSKRIRMSFGSAKNFVTSVKEDEFDGIDEQFSKTASVLFDHTLLLPRGCGQQIRGLNWRNHRPDLIIFDDPEDRKEIRNEMNRKENKTWFMGDVCKCVSLFDKDYEFLYFDTLKHADALPILIMEMIDWEHIRLAICDKNYKSLIPELISDEEVKEMVETHREAGALDEFYREYMNETTSPESAGFKREHFKYYEEEDLKPSRLTNVILLDPARSVTPQSDFSAIIGVGISLDTRKWYVRDIINERMYPDAMYEAAVAMARTLHAGVIAIEVTGLKEFILQPFKDYLTANNAGDIDIVELTPRGNMRKEDRIASLISPYRRGIIHHNKNCCMELEQQLLSFPNSRYDDIMDALAYLVELLEKGEMYNLPETETKYDSDVDIEKEYEELYNEPAEDQSMMGII